MIQSKGKNKLYDEKGLFGRVCRHDVPQGFLDIKHGERYYSILFYSSASFWYFTLLPLSAPHLEYKRSTA